MSWSPLSRDGRIVSPADDEAEFEELSDEDLIPEHAEPAGYDPTQARDPRVGTRVGQYDIVRVLACGGMGVVYHARHRRLGRKVAVKFPRPHVLRDRDLTQRFLSEAMAAVHIGHPGVVNVFDYGHAADGTPYLVMEFLEGEPLSDRMFGQPMALGLTLRVGARVADTLAAAHSAGVIHRDIKPENVFLQRHRHRPDRLSIKVLDFGFAKLTDVAAGAVPKTQNGLVLGTPSYMSPEQCLGSAVVDARSDIYSLGCILYEMMAGRLPFSGNLEQMKVALRYQPVISPRWYNRDIPEDLDALIMSMLGKSPADRPDRMIDIAIALDRMTSRVPRPRRACGTLSD